MSKSPQDQRLFDRIDVRFPARLNVNHAAEDADVVIKDLSPVGLKVFATHEVSLYDRLLISFAPQIDKPVALKGYVMWIEQDSSCSWHIGIQIDQVDLLKASRIMKFLREPSLISIKS